jgi:hypothetical protein
MSPGEAFEYLVKGCVDVVTARSASTPPLPTCTSDTPCSSGR